MIFSPVSTGLRSYAWFWIAAVGGGGLLFVVWRKTPAGRRSFERLTYRLPLFGKVVQAFVVSRFARTLGTLVAGGLPVVSCLEIVSRSIGTPIYTEATSVVGGKIREGAALWNSLEDTRLFPDLMIEMVKVGESSGSLAQMLEYVADFIDQDIDHGLQRLTSLAAPILRWSSWRDFIGNIRKEEAADKELRANAAFSGDSEKIAQYDRLAKNNSLTVKNDFGAATLYGKGSAKAGDTSAEAITLKQNQGQLPGEKGFTGGVDRQGTTIFPNIKGDKVTGQIPMESQMSGETYAGNTSKTYYKSDKPGTLGKLETLASGRTGDKSKSAIAESFGLKDQFNQTMGGKRNAARIGRDDKESTRKLLTR